MLKVERMCTERRHTFGTQPIFGVNRGYEHIFLVVIVVVRCSCRRPSILTHSSSSSSSNHLQAVHMKGQIATSFGACDDVRMFRLQITHRTCQTVDLMNLLRIVVQIVLLDHAEKTIFDQRNRPGTQLQQLHLNLIGESFGRELRGLRIFVNLTNQFRHALDLSRRFTIGGGRKKGRRRFVLSRRGEFRETLAISTQKLPS